MNIIEIIISVLLPIFFGYFLKLIKVFSSDDAITLRKFIVKASVPFIIFKNLYTADVSVLSQILPNLLGFIIISIFYTIFSKYTAQLVSKNIKESRAYSIATQFGNYGYLGWGIMFYFFSDGGFTRAVFFSMFFWPVFLILGFAMIFFETKNSLSKNDFFIALLKNATIPIISAILGLVFNLLKIKFHPVLKDFIFTFSSFTIPMILFTIGLDFNLKIDRKRFKIALFSSFVRLVFGIIFGLICVFIISRFFRIDELTFKVILLETVMPTATMTAFFADFIEMDKELLASTLTLSTLLSLITLPLWYYLIQTQYVSKNILPFFVR
ncbi:MAG: hypothetical protein GYA61_09025 [Spirochaetales bacterium]|nr:hypothetical protein [Spirochaetales bacterium]